MNRELKLIQLFHILLSSMVITFAIVVGVIYRNGLGIVYQLAPGALRLIQTLSGANVFLFLTGWNAATMLEKKMISATNSAGESVSIPRRWQNSRMIAILPREGCAFFGLVVCLLATLNRVLYFQPLFWLNTLPVILYLGYAAVRFPSEESFKRETETA